MPASRITPDVTAIKAMAHPLRMRMLGLLRMDGPATATQLAQRLDLNTGATSYHLRQLEKHGFITEDTDRGTGRERWWRAAHEGTMVDAGRTEAERDASDAFAQAATIEMEQQHRRALAERTELPEAWRRLSYTSDYYLRLTLDQATELAERMFGLLDEFSAAHPPQATEPGAEPYMVQVYGFPRPGALPHADQAGTPA